MSYNGLDDSGLDARVVRELSRLPSLAPRPGFSDRVMARVRPPAPGAVVLFRRAVTWAREPRRALALAGAYALSATVALALLLPWLLANSAQLRTALDRVGVQVLGTLRDWALGAATWSVTSGLVDFVRSLDLGSGRVAFAAVALTACYGGCALTLHYLLRAPRGTNVPAQAQL